MRKIFILLLLLITGCSSPNKRWESNASKWLIPVNASLAYFGNVALHEAGHALTAKGFGTDVIRIELTPSIHQNQIYFGTTVFNSAPLSDTELTVVNTMGPTATFYGHMLTRETLKTNIVPPAVQPTLAWFGFFGRISYYYQILKGFVRNEYADLGKEEAWISGVMLGGALIYEIYDLFFSDVRPGHQFLTLIGEHFYEEPRQERYVDFIMGPQEGGGFFGISFNW